MKLFFWQLNAKEKFFRSLWGGLLAFPFLYFVCWFFVDDSILLKIWTPMILTLLYFLELLFRYLRWKKSKIGH
ncbi:hypothetical protein [Lysinibacillus sp. BW-2-10]|uniref:hypothetical protein n=1 Tax=Lysinibacillus sp. BW-2-10 TaxID=2590030 RepID=UPI00117C8CE0|nr:hypothetical protein [Lysinibacillus sp. BW-2-10]TSI02539.1 hypothetical protein FJQ64_18260 [Lysinibacillus sp. BW-2-10]